MEPLFLARCDFLTALTVMGAPFAAGAVETVELRFPGKIGRVVLQRDRVAAAEIKLGCGMYDNVGAIWMAALLWANRRGRFFVLSAGPLLGAPIMSLEEARQIAALAKTHAR